MEKQYFDKIIEINRLREKAHAWYSEKSKVYQSFVSMEKSVFKDSNLRKRDKELIAIGISVAVNCESCMEWHIRQAFLDGSTEEEILEAIEVGIEMSGGPGTVAARFAMEVIEYYKNKIPKI